jgi:CTP synthase (UTP-ammonia lyase)
MQATLRVGLVGDHDDGITAHRAIPLALKLASEAAGVGIDHVWLATETIADDALLAGFDALWCVPGSPYRDMDGALRAIRFARERRLPFLGTCGGFQHAVIEFARHVLGWADAEHAETTPEAARPVISLLACGLVEASETLRSVPGSRIARACGETFEEGYRCRYGLDPRFAAALTSGPLRASAFGPGGEVRAVELDEHPFFVATLFQPERQALSDRLPPLVGAMIREAMALQTSLRETA